MKSGSGVNSRRDDREEPGIEPGLTRQVWGGISFGTVCAKCGTPIMPNHPEIEVVQPPDAPEYYHPACFDAPHDEQS